MFQILVSIHLLISVVLVVVVLLQAGKGGGLASAFGGAGGTDAVLGGRGAATFLSKLTTVLGTIFFVTSLSLAITSTSVPSGANSRSEAGAIREPQPFNPEAEMLIESTDPNAVSERVEEVEGESE